MCCDVTFTLLLSSTTKQLLLTRTDRQQSAAVMRFLRLLLAQMVMERALRCREGEGDVVDGIIIEWRNMGAVNQATL